MSVKTLAVLLVGCLAIFFLATPPANAQQFATLGLAPGCTAIPIALPDLNAEGIAERISDFVIVGPLDSKGNNTCFTAGTKIQLTFNAVMSYPTTFNTNNNGTYWFMYDPGYNGTPGYSIGTNGISVQTAIENNQTITLIEVDIENGSLNPFAFLAFENLRFDVTGTTSPTGLVPPYAMVPDGSTLDVTVGTTNPNGYTSKAFHLGTVRKTVEAAGVTDVGWGFEDGVCPFKFGCGYPNQGATTGSLIDQAWWYMRTNHLWSTDFAFRRTTEKSPAPFDPDPIPLIGPTDLVIEVENIMSGVTVTLPGKLTVCDSRGVTQAEWTLAKTNGVSSNGDLIGIYQTTKGGNPKSVTLTVGTTNGSAYNGCPGNPLISVKIGNPSGNSPDGTMTAYLRVLMGPATDAQFTGDDAPSAAVPRYLDNIAASGVSRIIIGDANKSSGADDQSVPYFFLNPTQTVLLFPYVVSTPTGNGGYWETGIEIGNTGLDTPVFGNSGQNGALDFYFFQNGACVNPNNCAPYTPTTLVAGADYANTLTNLLTAAKIPTPFIGYVIVVAHFNYGHGAAMIFSGMNAPTAVPALVLGGNCSMNPNESTVTPSRRALTCASARQGDLTKLPERLVM